MLSGSHAVHEISDTVRAQGAEGHKFCYGISGFGISPSLKLGPMLSRTPLPYPPESTVIST